MNQPISCIGCPDGIISVHEQRLGMMVCKRCREKNRERASQENLLRANQKAFRFERFNTTFRKMVNL